jgi:hypothetical protein
MCIKYLHFAENGVKNDDTGGCFADEPIAGYNLYWRAI